MAQSQARGEDQDRQSGGWHTGLLHVGMLGLWLVEIAILCGRLNTDRLLDDERPWARVFLEARQLAPILIIAVAAVCLIAWPKLSAEYRLLADAPALRRNGLCWLFCHVGALLALYQLSAWILNTFDGGSGAGFLWIACWLLLAFVVPLTLALVLFPFFAVSRALRRLGPSFMLSAAIGIVTVIASGFVLAHGLWRPLLTGTTAIASFILDVLPGPALVSAESADEGFTLTLGSFAVLVTGYCSGSEGLALIAAFLTVYFVAFRRHLRFPHVLLLVPLALAAIYLLNGIRLAALVWLGNYVSADVAMNGFHSHAGWISFCALALTVVFLSRRMRWFAFGSSTAALDEALPRRVTVNPAAVYLGPFLAMLAASFLTGALTSGFDWYYPLRVLLGVGVLWWARPELGSVSLRFTGTGFWFGLAAFVVWFGLERLGVQTRQSAWPIGFDDVGSLATTGFVMFRVIGFAVVVPIAEELAFRGFLMRRLTSAAFESLPYRAVTPVAWVASSLAFGLLHGQWIAGVIVGALYGLAAMRRGRLGDAIVAHATTNALLVLAALVAGPWYSWL